MDSHKNWFTRKVFEKDKAMLHGISVKMNDHPICADVKETTLQNLCFKQINKFRI